MIETDMDWKEFTVLLSGIMPETPLGKIVAIRCEENKDILKNLSPEENRIRNDWRSRHSLREEMTEAEMEKAVSSLQETIARAFG